MRPEVRRAPARVPSALLAVAAVLALAGCGEPASPPIPSTGVDDLVIPTPSPDPSDFVDEVDNPWLPLEVGATWVYAAGRATSVGASDTLTVAVTEGPEVEGVATTEVVSVEEEGGDEVRDLFAQDRDGNVWWFGRVGEWTAGTDGAQAGLAMAAEPRVGDGYREGLLSGVVDVRTRVVALDGSATLTRGEAAGDLADLLVVDTTSLDEPGRVVRSFYERGTGLVVRETRTGLPETSLGLVAHDEPQD